MHLLASVLFVLFILLTDSHLDLWILSNSSYNVPERAVNAGGRFFGFQCEYVWTDTFCVEKRVRLNYTCTFICISKLFFSTLNLLRMWEIAACLCDISLVDTQKHTLRVVMLVKWLQKRFFSCKEKRQLSPSHTISLFFPSTSVYPYLICRFERSVVFPGNVCQWRMAKWRPDCVSRPTAVRVSADFIRRADAGRLTNALSCLITSSSWSIFTIFPDIRLSGVWPDEAGMHFEISSELCCLCSAVPYIKALGTETDICV